MREGQLWAAAPIRQAASARTRSGEARAGPTPPGAGGRAGSDGGMDDRIAANGNEG